jgi:nitrate/nitrite transport system substrate-binding protein
MMKSTPRSSDHDSRTLNRRAFISHGTCALGATALLSHLPKAWAAPDLSSDAPESPNVAFGFIALTDCSPIVIAHEKGFFKKYGINSVIKKGANWAAIRDMLSTGETQATHMLIGMPLASTMGLAGFAEEADGDSVAAEPQRSGHHAEERTGRARSAPTPRPSSPTYRRPRAWANR